jgi:hypothetical protein
MTRNMDGRSGHAIAVARNNCPWPGKGQTALDATVTVLEEHNQTGPMSKSGGNRIAHLCRPHTAPVSARGHPGWNIAGKRTRLSPLASA